MRKQFSDRTKAESFATIKRVAMVNKGRAQQMIRPDELKRMSARETELVNLQTRTINIPAEIARKSTALRQFLIREGDAARRIGRISGLMRWRIHFPLVSKVI